MDFINKDEYIAKRTLVQDELKGMQPFPQGQLEEALKLFRDFRPSWETGELYQRKHLLGLVVEKVWVKHNEISAITLRPSYHLVVSGLKKAIEDQEKDDDRTGGNGNSEEGEPKEKTTRQLDRWLYGSDGRGTRSGNTNILIVAFCGVSIEPN